MHICPEPARVAGSHSLMGQAQAQAQALSAPSPLISFLHIKSNSGYGCVSAPGFSLVLVWVCVHVSPCEEQPAEKPAFISAEVEQLPLPSY